MNFHVGKKKKILILMRKEREKQNLDLKQFFMNKSNLQKWKLKSKAIFLPEALLLGKSQLPVSMVVSTARLQILHGCACWQSSASLNAVGSVRTW